MLHDITSIGDSYLFPGDGSSHTPGEFWKPCSPISVASGLENENYVPVNSKTAHPPRAIPGHLTRIKLCTVGNLTQNEARPVGHLTFLSKRLSAVGSKRISQFFDSAGKPRSLVIALVDSTWVFLLLWFYIVLSWNIHLNGGCLRWSGSSCMKRGIEGQTPCLQMLW